MGDFFEVKADIIPLEQHSSQKKVVVFPSPTKRTSCQEIDSRETLVNWGFPEANFLAEDGVLPKDVYLKHLKKAGFKPESGYLGEVKIPDGLLKKIRAGNIKAVTHEMTMGLGHKRLARYFSWITGALGIKTYNVGTADKEKIRESRTPLLETIFEATLDRYRASSIDEAFKRGMISKELSDKCKFPFKASTIPHRFFKLIAPEQYRKFMLGDTRDSKPEDVAKRQKLFEVLRKDYARALIGKTGENVIHFIFHPLLSALIPEGGRAVLIATDAVVAPDWYIRERKFPLMVETPEAKELLDKFWKKEEGINVVVTGGFMGTTAEYEAEKLTFERKKSKLPPVLILPGSGVSPLQVVPFEETIEACASLLNEGKLRIFVQAGYGRLGKIAFDEISGFVDTLSKKYPNLKSNVLVHLTPTALGAIDAVEVLSRGKAPIILNVKGGEMARVAVSDNIPYIPNGAVGIHEVYNIYLAIKQGAPVYLTQEVFDQLIKQVEEYKIEDSDKVIGVLRSKLCGDFSNCLARAEKFYQDYTKPLAPITKRGNALIILDYLLNREEAVS